MNKKSNKGFTLIELLAVVVVLGVVVTIAVLAVKPRTRSAKKNLFIADAKSYMKAAKEAYTLDEAEGEVVCHNISDLNSYVQKHDNNYTGTIISEFTNGTSKQTISITDGRYYIFGSDNITSSNLSEEMPAGFISTCTSANNQIPQDLGTTTLAYKLLMSEGKGTLTENLALIDQRTSTVNLKAIEENQSKSGLYKSEDDDGTTYYYRGVVNNNWLEFGGFYWRIVRINGDGSIRLIYSGLKNSNHTGANAAIKSNTNGATSRYSFYQVYYTYVNDISGLTSTQVKLPYSNGNYGHTYAGYMYNPKKVLMSYQTFLPSNTKRLNNFTQLTNINATKSDYYFFKNFDLNNDCFTGNDNDDTGSCILKCRELGDDCIASNWNTLATTEGNYSTTADGVYPATNPTNYIYTSPYKYTCWGNSTPVTKANSDGTTSVYISCPIVSEIVGTIKNQATQARIRIHGLFAPDLDTALQDIYDSNIKTQMEYWYEHNIYNVKDSSDEDANYLESYIADEVFCGDRTSNTDNYPLANNGSHFMYNSYLRLTQNGHTSTLKCPNLSRDGYTLDASNTQSIVTPKGVGNKKLKYPVATITADEMVHAGGKYNTPNLSYYMYVGVSVHTMTPYNFYAGNLMSSPWIIGASGNINGGSSTNAAYLRPVINLKSDVIYKSGSGTEADPYIITL